MGFQKILCPVDFSDAASEAVQYASAWASHFGGAVTLLHVEPPVSFDFALARPAPESLVELAAHRNQTVRDAMESFESHLGLSNISGRNLAEGNAAEEITSFAKRESCDLIVMPTHGTGAIRRLLLVGSVTTKVLHLSECPVLAGIDFSERYDPLQIRRIVCAVDLGPQSARALCYAHGLAREFGAAVTIVHAAPGWGKAGEDFLDESWRLILTSRLTEKISLLQQQAGTAAEVLVEGGDPHKVVPDVAQRLDADLIVIGHDSSNGVIGRLRAHSYEIIRHAPCPVLSV